MGMKLRLLLLSAFTNINCDEIGFHWNLGEIDNYYRTSGHNVNCEEIGFNLIAHRYYHEALFGAVLEFNGEYTITIEHLRMPNWGQEMAVFISNVVSNTF